MSTARIGDVDLEYYVEGNGEPLVLIMGFLGTADSWSRPFVDALAKDFRVIRVSNRGTGASTDSGAELTARLMADDVVGLLDHLGIKRAHVFGISMGGRIAQELAIAYPDRVRRLVLASTDYGARATPAPEDVRAAMLRIASSGGQDGRDEFLRVCVAPGRLESGGKLPDGIVPERIDSGVLMRQLMAIRAFDTFERVDKIRSETLILQGAEDQINPIENGPALRERINGARLARIAGTGHMFVWEKPHEAAELVRGFLRGEGPAEAESRQTAVAGS